MSEREKMKKLLVIIGLALSSQAHAAIHPYYMQVLQIRSIMDNKDLYNALRSYEILSIAQTEKNAIRDEGDGFFLIKATHNCSAIVKTIAQFEQDRVFPLRMLMGYTSELVSSKCPLQ